MFSYDLQIVTEIFRINRLENSSMFGLLLKICNQKTVRIAAPFQWLVGGRKTGKIQGEDPEVRVSCFCFLRPVRV